MPPYAHADPSFSSTFARVRYELGTRRALFGASRTLRHAAHTAGTAAEVVDAVFRIRVGNIRIGPVQVPSEITRFLSLVRAERPRRVLEIGTADGGTLYLLAWASADDARLLSLDLRSYEPERQQLFRAFARKDQVLTVRQADSQLEATRDEVVAFFDGERLDILFIDGDHAYEGVRRDYELFAPIVRSGGIVAFHDIVDGPPESIGGVPRFWREIRGSLTEPTEIIEARDQGGFGIGVGWRH